MRITLTNDFHNSSVNLNAYNGDYLSPYQIKRAKKQLCGSKNCQCSGDLGTRGTQNTQVELNYWRDNVITGTIIKETPEQKYWMPEDFEKIESLLGVKAKDQMGGITSFKEITHSTLTELLDAEIAELEGCQNCSPSFQSFVEFLEDNPGFTVSGYVVWPPRSDYRVTIELVECKDAQHITKESILNFIRFAQGADEITAEENQLSAWWN